MPADQNSPSKLALLAVAGDDSSIAAARYGAHFATRLGFRLGLFHIGEYPISELLKMKASGSGEIELAKQAAQEKIEPVRKALSSYEWEEFIELGEIASGTIRATSDEKVALVVVGRRKLGLVARLILGRVSLDILHASKAPVLIVPPQCEVYDGPSRILVTTDLTELSRAAFPAATQLALAGAENSEIIVLHVGRENVDNSQIKEILTGWVNRLKEKGVEARVRLEQGKPLDVITKVVTEERVTELVIATHGRVGIKKWFVGSTTEALLGKLGCPVLVVKQFDEEDEQPAT